MEFVLVLTQSKPKYALVRHILHYLRRVSRHDYLSGRIDSLHGLYKLTLPVDVHRQLRLVNDDYAFINHNDFNKNANELLFPRGQTSKRYLAPQHLGLYSAICKPYVLVFRKE